MNFLSYTANIRQFINWGIDTFLFIAYAYLIKSDETTNEGNQMKITIKIPKGMIVDKPIRKSDGTWRVTVHFNGNALSASNSDYVRATKLAIEKFGFSQ